MSLVPTWHDAADGSPCPIDREPETDCELVVGLLYLCGVAFWEWPRADGPCGLSGGGRRPLWLMHFRADGSFIGLYACTLREGNPFLPVD